ncbi:MAG: nicotinate-nucleotide adenylyltransferase [Chitinophagaceae bacterium]|nr:MAG: nicotinate-nucleotide adenylyltransferase [Chitinophagaceae bacterium]
MFCLLGSALPALSQDTLPEIRLIATKYKYLRTVDNAETPRPAKLLEHKAAAYDVKKSDYYEEEYDTYFISFIIPEGEMLATYDQNGKLLRTAEKYKDVKLPKAVADAVVDRFPNWHISKDVYLVNYYEGEGAKKVYKLLLENGDKRMRVKANDNGEFL